MHNIHDINQCVIIIYLYLKCSVNVFGVHVHPPSPILKPSLGLVLRHGPRLNSNGNPRLTNTILTIYKVTTSLV
jgi:hypothetical protein